MCDAIRDKASSSIDGGISSFEHPGVKMKAMLEPLADFEANGHVRAQERVAHPRRIA
jgi:hypothetical protein